MKVLKKIFTSFLLSLSLLLIFPGCFQKEQKTLRIWHTEADPNAKQVFDEIVKKYEEKHPNVKIEWEAISWGALSEKLTTALSTGDVPDIIHLQPFMAASLYNKGLLEPMDEVINAIGSEDIYPSVKNLQYFDSHYYGIAYAIGTTYFSYRKDWADEKGLQLPKTWQEYIAFANSLNEDTNADGIIDHYGVILPGGSPFFLDQLFSELVASNGGRLFAPDGKPTFKEKPVLETLEFYNQLSKLAPPDWTSEEYANQFRTFALGKGASVPVTYARASKQIDKDAQLGINDPEHFAVMEQPVGPSGTESFSTIDCEPWAIFKSSKSKNEAKEFLKFFYQKENYLKFCIQLPIHLTPILKSLAESQEYLNNDFIKKWKPWQDMSLRMINNGRVHPIFLTENDDRDLPFLLELQGSRIITDMILAVTNEGKEPIQAATEAQQKAEELIEKLGYKKW